MEYDDPVFLDFMAALRRNMEIVASVGVVGFLPWLKNILPPSWTGVNLMQESLDSINVHFKVFLSFYIFINKSTNPD